MAHLNPEQLAGLASDPSYPLTHEEHTHLGRCRVCTDRAADLDHLVRDVQRAGSAELHAPPPAVWTAIERQLDEGPRSALRPGRPRRGWVRPAVAAAAGLVVGIGGTLGVLATRPADVQNLVAQARLAPLPGEAGQGTAQLVRTGNTLQLRVHVALGTSPTHDYREVWLINADGRRMYALGVLPSSGDASYWLPVPLREQLDGYSTVDISLEPEDGNSAHSGHSLVRGHLPA